MQVSNQQVPRKDAFLAFSGSRRPGVFGLSQGATMGRHVEEQKRRLTDRVDIMMAIDLLKSRGYEQDDLIEEITKAFYVDLDAYNEVMAAA